MSHNNPLENFLKPGDVEMIDPLNSSKQKEEEKEENKKEPSNLEFDIPIIVPLMSDGVREAKEVSREDNEIPHLNFNAMMIEPKLPETGLKSRPLPIFTDSGIHDNNLGRFNIVVGERNYDNVCSQDSRQM